MDFLANDSEIDINTRNPEFSAWQWMTKKQILENIVPFKKKVYNNIFETFSAKIKLN